VLHDYAPIANQPWLQPMLASVAGSVASAESLLQEFLGETNDPCTVTGFMEAAARHRLELVGESAGVLWPPHAASAPLQKALAELGGDRLATEQYFDALTGRTSRASLVRRAGSASPSPTLAAWDRIEVSASVRHANDRKAIRKAGTCTFLLADRHQLTVEEPAVKCFLAVLAQHAGAPVLFSRLLEETEALLCGSSSDRKKASASGLKKVRETCLALIGGGFAIPWLPAEAAWRPCASVPAHPLATPLNRVLAKRGLPLLSADLRSIPAASGPRALVAGCDGRTDHDGIFAAWCPESGNDLPTRAGFDATLAALLREGILVEQGK
jgi:hypothetical protein